MIFHSNAEHPYVAEAWHSDVTFLEKPSLGSILRCVVAPPFGGNTMWASMHAAYEALSDKMQRFLSELVAIHNMARVFALVEYRNERITPEEAEALRKSERSIPSSALTPRPDARASL